MDDCRFHWERLWHGIVYVPRQPLWEWCSMFVRGWYQCLLLCARLPRWQMPVPVWWVSAWTRVIHFLYVNILVCLTNDCGIILIQDCNCIWRIIFITQYFDETYEDDFWLLILKFIFQNILMFKICGVIFYLWTESNRAWYKTVTVGTEKLYRVSCLAQ